MNEILPQKEPKKRIPEGPTKAYLMIIPQNPRAVQNALAGFF